jgi:hypothetical protein
MSECACGAYHAAKCPVARALRDCWSTPQEIADIVGEVDLDPCSNDRSVVKACARATEAEDGLTVQARPEAVVFINPPYSRGQVIKWVHHYGHTRFIFLLRWDPSTEWFRELIGHCTHVWFPPYRISFVPPPRIKASSNPFPHALYLRDPSPELLARLGLEGVLVRVDAAPPGLYGGVHGHQHDDRAGSSGPGGVGVETPVGDRGGACARCGDTPDRGVHAGLCAGCLPA